MVKLLNSQLEIHVLNSKEKEAVKYIWEGLKTTGMDKVTQGMNLEQKKGDFLQRNYISLLPILPALFFLLYILSSTHNIFWNYYSL